MFCVALRRAPGALSHRRVGGQSRAGTRPFCPKSKRLGSPRWELRPRPFILFSRRFPQRQSFSGVLLSPFLPHFSPWNVSDSVRRWCLHYRPVISPPFSTKLLFSGSDPLGRSSSNSSSLLSFEPGLVVDQERPLIRRPLITSELSDKYQQPLRTRQPM